MTAQRTHVENYFKTKLTATMGPTDLETQVEDVGDLESPCILVLEPLSPTRREVILFDGSFTSSTFVTLSLGNRYKSGSAAVSGITHPVASEVWSVPLKQHFDDLHDRIDGVTTVVDGVVIDATDAAYGADPSGVADSSAAIQAAHAAAVAASASHNEGVSGGAQVRVWLPAGVYKVTESIDCSAYSRFAGDGAIIVPATDDFPVFSGVTYGTRFEGISIHGGDVGISIATTNLDTTRIDVVGCEFLGQATAAIDVDGSSQSTLLVIDRCKFYEPDGRVIDMGSGDKVVIRDSWVSCGHADSVYRVSGGQLVLDHVLGVPLNADGCWVELRGGYLYADHSRFGGEEGGRPIFDCYTAPDLTYPELPSVVSVKDCETYSTGFAARFYDLPNVFEWDGNTGLADNDGIYYDDAIPDASKAAFGSSCAWRIENLRIPLFVTEPTGDQFVAKQVLANRSRGLGVGDFPKTADLVRAIQYGENVYGLSASGAGVIAGPDAGPNMFGDGLFSWEFSADDGSVTINHTTALNGLAAGVYTMQEWVEVYAGTVQAIVTAGGTIKIFDLPPGRHLLNVPFAWDSSLAMSELVGIVIRGGPIGGQFGLSTRRIWSGQRAVQTPNAVVYGSAAPVSGRWFKGDVVLNTSPTTANPTGWVCTASGTSGTWSQIGSGFQPLDADLTALAALTTTSYGRSLLELANDAAHDALHADAFQPLDGDLTAIAALTTTSYGRAFLELANQAALNALVKDVLPWTIDISVFEGSIANTNWNTLVALSSSFHGGRLQSTDADGNEVAWDVVLGAGTWTISTMLYQHTINGKIDVYLDADLVGTLEGYGGVLAENVVLDLTGYAVAATGKKRLKFKINGKHASSTGYYGMLQHIQLRRTA